MQPARNCTVGQTFKDAGAPRAFRTIRWPVPKANRPPQGRRALGTHDPERPPRGQTPGHRGEPIPSQAQKSRPPAPRRLDSAPPSSHALEPATNRSPTTSTRAPLSIRQIATMQKPRPSMQRRESGLHRSWDADKPTTVSAGSARPPTAPHGCSIRPTRPSWPSRCTQTRGRPARCA